MKNRNFKKDIVSSINFVGWAFFGFTVALLAISTISPNPNGNPAIYVEVLRPLPWYLPLGIIFIISLLMIGLTIKTLEKP